MSIQYVNFRRVFTLLESAAETCALPSVACSGFGVWRFRGLGFGGWVFGVWGLEFGVQGLGFRVVEFDTWGLGFAV